MKIENPCIGDIKVIKRTGAVCNFDSSRIVVAITKAYIDEQGEAVAASASVRDKINTLSGAVAAALLRRLPAGGTVHIEDIQDQVELALMRAGEHIVARSYVLYREKRAQERAAQASQEARPTIHVKDGETLLPFDRSWLANIVARACAPYQGAQPEKIVASTERTLYDGVSMREVLKAVIMSARTLIETDPVYDSVTAQLLMHQIRKEVLGKDIGHEVMQTAYAEYLQAAISTGVNAGILDERLLSFDLVTLGNALDHHRDANFRYLGLQTLYDRYFVHVNDRRIELPQTFFMRVAMGLALNESDKNGKAIEFYNLLSSFDFMASTPTLFNSGTKHSQLSSCYLSTIGDDLNAIYDGIKDNALLSKWAGGLGNDWTNVRAMGARIKGTNGQSQGVVPFLKVVNDTAVAVNQGGKRKGAVCAYLESWHLDIEEFLDLRKNTGDDRRRTHDMNTANWIPDLFMKRVMEGGDWTMFSPNDVPDLHDKFGQAFETAYVAYERKADSGEIKLFKRVPAVQLWRKMLTMLFETGHPWIAFKDPCNIRSPQQHAGVVHSSNLCTEITLNTSDDEIAVCNLGSVNLANHVNAAPDGGWAIDYDKLRATVRTAMRMLDNVIDINYYAVEKARNANMRHRPVGMGIMGFQDVLYKVRVPYASEVAVQIAESTMEAVAYYAYDASSDLAAERGSYSSFVGSLWDRGILPHESLKLLQEERGGYLDVVAPDLSVQGFDWEGLRIKIGTHGIRNSNCLAIAPTATIANIVGVTSSIEPTYQNLFVKSNLSGEFTVINSYLVADLKALGLWDEVMVTDLKYFDGTVSKIDRIPDAVKALYATAFEIDPSWLIEAASRRQVWIDQAQSLNIYIAQPSGKKLDEIYKLAWLRGLKTTYYLRSLGATSAEKSTSNRIGQLNAVSVGAGQETGAIAAEPQQEVKFCSIDDPECEACQ